MIIKRPGRPKKLDSKSYKMEVACGNLFVTVSFYPKTGRPFETFVSGSKLRGCKANQEALGRLTSVLLQYDLLEEAIDQLEGIVCTSCSRLKGMLPKEKKIEMPNSCADCIAKVLKENYVAKQEDKEDKNEDKQKTDNKKDEKSK